MYINLPELSEKGNEVIITAWHVTENDRILKDQDILEVATDKATFDIPSPCDGILRKIIKKSGDKAAAGERVAEVDEDQN